MPASTPTMLLAVVEGLNQGRLEALALAYAPEIAGIEPVERSAAMHATTSLLVRWLLCASLVEAGAELLPSIGEPSVIFRFRGDDLLPFELADVMLASPAAREHVTALARELASSSGPIHAPPPQL